jgi:hypothetical protein
MRAKLSRRRVPVQTLQGSTLQSLVAVQNFLDAHQDTLGSAQISGSRKKLDDLVAQLTNHAAVQQGSTFAVLGATQTHRSLRAALVRDHMRPIARIAKAELPSTPAVEPLKMPRGQLSVRRLAAVAQGMAQAAAPFTDVFTGAGMPADFIAQLTAASDAVVASVGARMQTKGTLGGATQGLKTMLSRGRRIVHVLDAFVTTALQDDPVTLASWNIVKRVQLTARPGTVAPATPASTPTPASSPASSAASSQEPAPGSAVAAAA